MNSDKCPSRRKQPRSQKSLSFDTEPADELQKEIRDIFDSYDSQKSGKVDRSLLKVAMRALGFEPNNECVKHCLGTLERDNQEESGLSLEQFTKIVVEHITERDYRQDILVAFRLFDDDDTGKITFRNLKRVARGLGESMSDDELKQMILEADLDGDGAVNEEEFYRIMTKSNLY